MEFLFVKSELTLLDFGNKVKEFFNIGEIQIRDGLNNGGEYWLCEILGFEVTILLNEHESVFIEEMADYKFMMYSEPTIPSEVISKENLVKHLEVIMKNKGFICTVQNV